MISSPVDPGELEQTRRSFFLGLFVALAVALHGIETLLPSPAPWFRLGLANILALIALFLYGGRAVWTVTLGRIVIGSLLLGRLFSPGFLLSLVGGIAAAVAMIMGRRLGGRWIGPVGVSALGGCAHAVGQVATAWLLLVRHESLWRLLPPLLLFSLATAVANGFVAALILKELGRHPAFLPASENHKSGDDGMTIDRQPGEKQ